MNRTTHLKTSAKRMIMLHANYLNGLRRVGRLASIVATAAPSAHAGTNDAPNAISWGLILLAALLAAVTPLRADNPPTFVFQINSSAVPGGFQPLCIALDASNNMYVTDAMNNRVDKLTSAGAYQSQWGGLGTNNGQFYGVFGIALDSSNNVYVADGANKRVEKFDRKGTYLTQWGSNGTGNGQFAYPYGVAVDSSNNVYVADPSNSRVEKFNSNGGYIGQWGSYGTDHGQLEYPEGIAVDSSDNVYVVDYYNQRVEKYDDNGNYLTQWGSLGTNIGQFQYPQGIAVDRSNNVYVVDYRIQKFNANGGYITQWGGYENGNSQLDVPEGIALDKSGNYIYVANAGSDQIAVFVNDTNIIPPYIVQQPTNQTVPAGANVTLNVRVVGAGLSYQWSSNNVALHGATNAAFTVTNITLSAAYSMLVSNSYGSALSSNTVLTVLPAAKFAPPTFLYEIDSATVPGGFAPAWVALDASNNLYVIDGENDRVVKLTSAGAYLTQWGSLGTNIGQFQYPQGIAVDGGNNVYVVDLGNDRVQKFDDNGNYLAQWGRSGTKIGQFEEPEGIAVDSGNNLYVADQDNARIEKFNSNGGSIRQWGSYGFGNGQFAYPQGIAVDGENNVYVTDFYADRVQKFDDNGNYLTQWDESGFAMGIAADGNNNVYVVDERADQIEKFDSSGSFLTQWGSQGSGAGQFSGPVGIALDSTRNVIYVADSGNDRIEVFVNDTSIIPPFIARQPTNQTAPVGASVTLNLGMIGAALSYQWSSNNVAVNGATNAAFTLANVSLSDSATYAVLVSNRYGSVLSSNAVLTVLPAAEFAPPTFLYEIDAAAVPGGFQPQCVALDASNHLYMTDDLHSRVVKLSAGGAYLTQWGSFGRSNGQFEGPLGIAVDRSNNVYVVDESNDRVQKFDDNGDYLTQWGDQGSGNGQLYYPLSIALDGSTNVYVTDYVNSRVEKFDDNGKYLMQWGSYGARNGQFEIPESIAVDNSNNVYVTDGNISRVQKFDDNGDYLTQWGSRGSGNGQFGTPAGIAVDSGNNIYVVDYDYDRVEKFNRNGDYLTQWGTSGNGAGQLSGPEGIAVDSTGNVIYVADAGNDRIEIFINDTSIAPPVITNQPASQIVPAGVSVTFGVGLVGAAPIAYQWSINNIAVAGATNATFTLTNVSLSESGAICSVQVTNAYGNASSANAELTVFPVLVTTQPASGSSATGAMLNGTAVTGPKETVVWFDWGTDTNYGNIAGTTVLTGANETNNISATLSGLPGNYYHYRIDAANDFGIAYGADQTFVVGFAPSATTLPPTNAVNGATLAAVVNPDGWDTTVYFRWETPTLTNTTPGVDIGAGATSLSVSSFVPGLLASTAYQYQVEASNALGTSFGKVVFGDPNQFHFYFSGSETNITLTPGAYIITAYGAVGGWAFNPADYYYAAPGIGTEMSAKFNFSTSTTLTLLVGGAGGSVYISDGNTNYSGGGGGGGSFVVEDSTPLVIAGGGGGGAVSGHLSPPTVDGGNANTETDGGGGSGSSYEGFNDLFGAFLTGGAGGNYGGGGGGGLGDGGGGGGGFNGGGGSGTGSGSGAGGSSFINGGSGGIASYLGDGGRNFSDNSGGFGGGGAGYYNLGNSYFEFGFGGGGGGYSGGGGGGGVSGSDDGVSASVQMVGSGGGGGSIIDSSATAILAEVWGIYSPDDAGNGEIIITLVPPPPLAINAGAAFGFTNGVFGFNVTGPSGSYAVIQTSTDLQTWIPLQTNLLGAVPLYFSDPQSATNVQHFYRVQLSP